MRDRIRTYTGRWFRPLAPTVDDIDIEDIAHALSNICRWTGHVKQFMSVAQHSVLVSQVCKPEDALSGLLHDASEAYLADLASPVKHAASMEAYRKAERKLQTVIYQRFGLPLRMLASVALADKLVLAAEARALMGFEWPEGLEIPEGLRIEPLAPSDAKVQFLERYWDLSGELEDAACQDAALTGKA